MSDRATRVTALLRGVAVGDALGWPWERPDRVVAEPEPDGHFYRWRRRAGSRFWGYEESLPAGTYSDDTQLMLCVARSLLSDDWYRHLVGRELPTWRLYERGGGGAVLRAAKSWTDGRAPWIGPSKPVDAYFGAGANGVAMRIAPHVVVGGDGALQRVVIDGIATHGHPRALIGATLHAWTLAWALDTVSLEGPVDAITAAVEAAEEWGASELLDALPQSWKQAAGEDYPRRWSDARNETVHLLQLAASQAGDGPLTAEGTVLKELGATDRTTNGAGHVCAVAALFLGARYAAQPAQALQSAARQPGADTDTLAAMTGALVGALGGLEAIGGFPGVQDEAYITDIAAKLAKVDAPSGVTSVPDRLDVKLAKQIDEFPPPNAEDGTELALPDGRSARVVQTRVLSDVDKPNRVTGTWLRTADGQGLVAIRRQKVEPEAPPTDRSERPVQHAAPKQDETAGGRIEPDSVVATASPVAQQFQILVEASEPREFIERLQRLGLTGSAGADGWKVHGLPVVVRGTDPPGAETPIGGDSPLGVQRMTILTSADGDASQKPTTAAQLRLEVD